MSDVGTMTPSQIGNRICAMGLMELGTYIQSELQYLEHLRKDVARLNAEVKLLKEQLPPEAKEAAAKKLHETWLAANRNTGGSRRAPAISDG
jgi:septal ring factor EnvC (AmiA/AmiB activator)